MLRPLSLLAAALLSTTTLAAAAPVWAAEDGSSPYAAYLVGRAAIATGDRRDGLAELEALANRYPDQPGVRAQAFEAALFSGDIEGAAKFAPDAPSADDPADLASLGRIVRAVQDLAQNRPAEANKALDLKSIELPYRSAAFMLRPWVLAAAGNWNEALGEPAGATAWRRWWRAWAGRSCSSSRASAPRRRPLTRSSAPTLWARSCSRPATGSSWSGPAGSRTRSPSTRPRSSSIRTTPT